LKAGSGRWSNSKEIAARDGNRGCAARTHSRRHQRIAVCASPAKEHEKKGQNPGEQSHYLV